MLKQVSQADDPVRPRAAIPEFTDLRVPLVQAPDGLPMVLHVTRSASVVPAALRTLWVQELEELSPVVGESLRRFDALVQQERRQIGVVALPHRAHAHHYVTSTPVHTLFGAPLLARLLGGHSPMLLDDGLRGHHFDGDSGGRDIKTCAGVLQSVSERARVSESLDCHQQLAVPLGDGPLEVLRAKRRNSRGLHDPRAFIAEDLVARRTVRFLAWVPSNTARGQHVQATGALADRDADLGTFRRANQVHWTITRQEVLELIAQTAREVARLHDDGVAHADLKPHNILLTAQGPVAHDALRVPLGEICAAGTRGWNAPEQIIARPVSPGSHVFALAQLIVLALRAVIFGDERSLVVPTGGGSRARERLMPEPDVFLDPTLIPFIDAAVAVWREFLGKCLLLDTDKRLGDARAFADTLEQILSDHPVRGVLELTALPGEPTVFQPEPGDGLSPGDGGGDAVWVVRDNDQGVRETPWQLHGRLAGGFRQAELHEDT